MSTEKFLSWPEIEKRAKEVAILMNKNEKEIYAAIKQDKIFEDYIIRKLAEIMALAIARIKERAEE